MVKYLKKYKNHWVQYQKKLNFRLFLKIYFSRQQNEFKIKAYKDILVLICFTLKEFSKYFNSYPIMANAIAQFKLSILFDNGT